MLKKELEKLRVNEDEMKRKLEETNAELTTLCNEKQELEDQLMNQVEHAESKIQKEQDDNEYLKKELNSEVAKLNDLETKHKSLKSELTAKTKHIKELEKENKSLKTKLTSLTQTHEEQCGNFASDIESLMNSNSKLMDEIEEIRNTLEEQKKRTESAEAEVASLKSSSDAAISEKDAVSKNCDFRMKEMVAALERYKQENQKIVDQKDEELVNIRSQVEMESNNKCKKEIAALKEHLEELKTKNEELNAEKEEMVKKLETSVSDLKAEKIKLLEKLKNSTTMMPETPSFSKSLSDYKTPTRKPVTLKIAPVEATPRNPVISQNVIVVKTPQRSILRNQISLSDLSAKKRRVAFASDGENYSGSESSSSELMEVEMENINDRLKGKDVSTPLLVRPSPKLSSSPHSNIQITPTRTPLRPVPRGPSVKTQEKKFNTEKSPFSNSQELAKFKELFPEDEHDPSLYCGEKPKKSKTVRMTPNVRKAPTKPHGKFFGVSPKEKEKEKKKGKRMNKGQKQDLAWFDSDAIFGFGPED